MITAKLMYDSKYEYTGFSVIEEDNRSDFTYSNITNIAPISTEYIHYLFEVPKDITDTELSIIINFKLVGNEYSYKFR